MRQVGEIFREKKEPKKPIELTHYFNNEIWVKYTWEGYDNYSQIVFLGKSPFDDQIFACYNYNDELIICKGNLNDGIY